jgi:hypothetical protein
VENFLESIEFGGAAGSSTVRSGDPPGTMLDVGTLPASLSSRAVRFSASGAYPTRRTAKLPDFRRQPRAGRLLRNLGST